MNRSDAVKAVIWLDQIVAKAKEEAESIRGALAADARAELEEQGTAPTWRLPDLGTVTLSVTREQAAVTDAQAFAEWCEEKYPGTVTYLPVIHAGWQRTFLTQAALSGESVVDPQTGEVVPGLAVKPGGQPIGVSVKASTEAKQVYGEIAGQSLRRLALAAGPAVPVVLAELGVEPEAVRDAAA